MVRRVGVVAAVAFAVATMSALARPVSSGTVVLAQDRAATLAYLKAQLAYEKARVADAAASRESLQALAGRLDGECPGVVAGMADRKRPTGGPRSPRQDGEEDRNNRQRRDVASEVDRAIDLAREMPYRQAALAFARRVLALRWSDAMVTAYEHANARATEWEAGGAVPAVCADLRVWAQSGYARLAPATKALTSEEQAADRPLSRLFGRLFREAPDALFSNPLARYEAPRARAVARRLVGVWQREVGASRSVFEVGESIRLSLGVISEAEVEELKKVIAKGKGHELPPRGSVVIGKGRTAAGGSYTIWVEPHGRHGGMWGGLLEPQSTPRACRRWVGILEPEKLSDGIEASGEPGVACLSRSHPMAPRVRCNGERRTIEAQTLADARRVRLTLADGRRIVSRVAIVPRRLGGPEGFYYQALQVWNSPPVSLTELDRRGGALKTLALTHQPRCVTQWPFIRPGGVRRVVRGRVPGGPGFSILASREESFGTLSGAGEISLRAEVGKEVGIGGIEREPGGPFPWQIKTGCEPHEYAILYGILKNPHNIVWARGPGGLVRLRQARLPASLHERGVLAFAAFPAVPSELIVRAADGKTVYVRKLAGIAREARETCEGEAEPT